MSALRIFGRRSLDKVVASCSCVSSSSLLWSGGRRRISSAEQASLEVDEPKTVVVDENNRPLYKMPGKSKWWDDDPVRIGPERLPLQTGPDFTFKGKKIRAYGLKKKVVAYLAEISEAESECEAAAKKEETNRTEYLRMKPKAKGMKLKGIFH